MNEAVNPVSQVFYMSNVTLSVFCFQQLLRPILLNLVLNIIIIIGILYSFKFQKFLNVGTAPGCFQISHAKPSNTWSPSQLETIYIYIYIWHHALSLIKCMVRTCSGQSSALQIGAYWEKKATEEENAKNSVWNSCPLLGNRPCISCHEQRDRQKNPENYLQMTPRCHVFLGRPRRLVPGIARFITLRVTLFASRLWTCPNQRRRPLRITSSIGVMCSMRRIFSFHMTFSSRHSEDPAKHPHLRCSNLPLVGHLHCPTFASMCQSRSDNGLIT